MVALFVLVLMVVWVWVVLGFVLGWFGLCIVYLLVGGFSLCVYSLAAAVWAW